MTQIEKLKDLVYKEKRTVSVRDICTHLNVHVSEARRILDDLLSEEKTKQDAKLNVTYIVTGTGLDSTDDYKVHKVTYAKCDELDKVRKGFATVASCKVFSICLNDEETTLKEEKEPLLDRETLLQQQRLTYIVNDDIQLRPNRLERLKLILETQMNNRIKSKIESNKKRESSLISNEKNGDDAITHHTEESPSERNKRPEPKEEEEEAAKKPRYTESMKTEFIPEKCIDDDHGIRVRITKSIPTGAVKRKSEIVGLVTANDKANQEIPLDFKKLKMVKVQERPKGKKSIKTAKAQKGQAAITNFFKPITK